MINNIKFWCQKVLPLVYDDSLSYYELLCKFSSKLNELINYTNTIPEQIADQLKNMLDNGTLTEIIKDWIPIIPVNNPPIGFNSCVGDGLTDNTENLQKIIDFCAENNYVCFIPSGIFLTKDLIIPNNLTIKGESKTASIIKASPFSTFAVLSTKNFDTLANDEITDVNNGNNNVTISNINISGSCTNCKYGLAYYGVALTLDSVVISNFANIGCWVESPGGLHSIDFPYSIQNHLSNITIFNCNEGNFYYNGQSDSNFYDILLYYGITTPASYNLKIGKKGAGSRIYGVHVWGSPQYGIICDGFGTSFSSAHLEGATIAKLSTSTQCYFDGRIYETSNNPTIGIVFTKSVRNSYFRFNSTNLKYCVQTNNVDNGYNTYIINGLSTIDGAEIFDPTYNYSPNSNVEASVAVWNGEKDIPKIIYRSAFYSYDNLKNQTFINQLGNLYFYSNTSNNRTFYIHSGSKGANTCLSVMPDVNQAVITLNSNEENGDIFIAPKGTGLVKMGYYTGTPGEITGYITIKDHNGTERKLAVIS